MSVSMLAQCVYHSVNPIDLTLNINKLYKKGKELNFK